MINCFISSIRYILKPNTSMRMRRESREPVGSLRNGVYSARFCAIPLHTLELFCFKQDTYTCDEAVTYAAKIRNELTVREGKGSGIKKMNCWD